jgi:hypothetical protein
MKKLVLAAIMMLVPFTSFALDKMNDAALDKMTAQEGVTISFENLTITQTSGNLGWHDGDGIGAGSTAGRIFIGQTGNTTTVISGSMLIDVATATAAIIGTNIVADTTFVKISLPSIAQTSNAKTMTVNLDHPAAADSGLTAGYGRLGTLYQDASTTTINGGTVYIYAH